MNKYLFLIFLLMFPMVSWSQSNVLDSKPVKELTSSLEKGSDQVFSNTGRSLTQAFEDFKKDPIGELKKYWEEGKTIFFNLLKIVQDGYEALKRKYS